jgi:hypothetical protein
MPIKSEMTSALTPALPMNPVAQTFLSAGSRDILVSRYLLNCTDWRLESRLNPQTRMFALHTVQGRQALKKVRGNLSPRRRGIIRRVLSHAMFLIVVCVTVNDTESGTPRG